VSAPATPRRGPAVALGLVIVGAVVAHGTLAQLASTPVVFDDELIYWEAARSVAQGDGVEVRDGSYVPGLAILYPVLLSPLLWAVEDPELAYRLAKLLNSIAFALAALPIYLLARRLLPPWPSVAAAALSVAIPSAMYASVLMSESLAYLVACCSLLAIVLALERPTWSRLGVALLVIVLAAATRLQFLVLLPAFLLALGGRALVLPSRRDRARSRATALARGWVAVGLGVAALGLTVLVVRTSPSSVFGAYTALWDSYELVDVPGGLLGQLANLSFYVAVVPLVVAPIVLSAYVRRARAGSEPHAAFVLTFVAANASFLTLAAVFDVSIHSLDRLHDRYAFYVVPLWLVVLVAWVHERAPRPLVASGVGAGLALLLAVAFPLSALDARDGGKLFEGVGTTLWAALDEGAGSDAIVRAALIACALAAVGVVLLVPRRLAWIVAVGAAGVILFTDTAVWGLAVNTARTRQMNVFGDGGERRWVDPHVGGASVATIFVPCGGTDLAREGFFQTEIFNASIENAFHFVDGYAYTASSTQLDVADGGRLVLPSGAPLVVDYVIAQRGLRLLGRRVATGTTAALALWDIRGPVRARDHSSADEVVRAVCDRVAR
jgi:Dolichyl-phosphate-mannose-protein mannosyltransferase